MAVTMKELAQVAGVSTATVSKIINGTDQHISAATRKRILALIDEMGYVPNAVAKGLKVKRTNMLGFILPDIANPFFPEIARGIEDTAQKHGFGMVMYNTDDDAEREVAAFRFLSSRMVDGIVFIRSLRQGTMNRYFDAGIPTVMVDREIDDNALGFGQVFVDTQKGTYASTRMLIEANCRAIAFISAENTYPFDRFNGYAQALKEVGLNVNTALVYRDRYNVQTGYDGIGHVLQQHRPDGIVCGNDLIAVGVMNALHEKGIQIPGDIKVVGFDDIYFACHLNPPLSTVHQPAYQMGAAAALMLIKNILHGKALYKKQLDFALCMRGTV